MNKDILLLILVIIFLILIYFVLIIDSIYLQTKNKIEKINNVSKTNKVIVVLGAKVKSDGTPTDILRDRLDTAMELLRKEKGASILLTGDGQGINNETKVMKNYILSKNKLYENLLTIDSYGFNTLESIKRIKKFFNINDIIIVTNKFHLPRSLYIAEKMGITAIGVSSDKGEYDNIDYYEFRELIALIKDKMKMF